MPSVDVVIPVYNEERDIPQKIPILHQFLAGAEFPYHWRIVIADNASTDGTPAVSQRLAKELSDVAYVRIPVKGRGHALKATWGDSPMDIVSYMDVDLSTGLEAFPPLIAAIAAEGYDVAIGSRLAAGAQIKRSLRRDILSRGYNLLIRAMHSTRFSDAQCGFKAVSSKAARQLVPLIEDGSWFFDTELLILAEKMGYRIKEVPVRWEEDPDTRVHIGRTIWEDVRGLWRLRRKQPWRRSGK